MPTDGSNKNRAFNQASLRARVLWVSLVWVALALAATGYVLNQLFEHHVRQQYQQQLQVYADYVLAGLEPTTDGRLQTDQSPQSPRFLQPLSGLYWQVNNERGEAVLRSRSLWDQKLQAPSDVLSSGQAHFHLVPGPQGVEVLMLEQTIRFEALADQSWRLLVAEDAQAFMRSIDDWRQMLFIFLAVLFVCLAVAAFAQIVVGFAPLRRLQTSIRQLEQGDVKRLEGEYPNEFSALVDGFNGVLDANERIVERARAQAGDLAHAIKTPLTVMSTALDRADGGQVSDVELAGLIREQISVMRTQVDWRLRRARMAAQSGGISRQVCEVQPIIEPIVRVMQKLYAEREIQFGLEPMQAGLRFLGESQDLAEMVGNLLDNAGKWAKSMVTVRLAVNQGQLCIEIEDDGPGIAVLQRAEVVKRGTRMDEQVPGAGLGLAIVKELVELYEGSLELNASRFGGLLATLRLPGRSGD